ncbi:MAG: calcium-binding protein [Methylocystaceae bacterium]|nr:MAG: calcium-binding protein [Methylocystaceae bacterium]
MNSKSLALALTAGLALAPMAATFPAQAAQSPIKTFDTDNDGTLDLAEVKKAASAVFDRLEKDNDATLDRKEVGSRIPKKEFIAADPDNDATLTKDEYLALVEKLFKQADPDNDGTLDAKELKSKAGRALVRLIR